MGELPGRRHGPAWARVRSALGHQSAAHLLRGLGFRPDGAGAHDGGLRRQAPGDVRDHVDHRRAGARPDARRVREQRQIGNGSVSRKPTASRFRARGFFLVVAVPTEKQFGGLMRVLGRADALDDPRFKDWPARTANEPALREIIATALATDNPKSWEVWLTAADVPCGSI